MMKDKLSVSPRLWNGYADIADGFKEWRLWLFLGYQDIRQRYVRSTLGPLWMVMGLGATILGVGFLYGQIFKTGTGHFLPFLAVSLAAWNFISAAISDGFTIFQAQASLLKSISVPYSTIILRNIVKNVIVYAHYLIAVAVTFALTQFPIDLTSIFVVPGLILVCANLYWITFLSGMICARFRDVAQIGIYGLQMLMFMTPIVWQPSQVRANSPFVVYNPMYHLVELIRAPLLEHTIPVTSFAVCTGLFVVGTGITALAFDKSKRYINFWI
jgi:ABC-type polysaccharide/polyol phosphate export permease